MEYWIIIDQLLISLYRITGESIPDYFIGTFLLALITVLIGDFTTSLVYLTNRNYFIRLNTRLGELHELSMVALGKKNKTGYHAINREANDTFGLVFFGMVGLSAAYLWPVFFALAWMQTRFVDISFPLFTPNMTVSYIFTFLICYLIARLIFTALKPHLPYFKQITILCSTVGTKANQSLHE